MPRRSRFAVLVMGAAAIVGVTFFASPTVTGRESRDEQRAVGTSGRYPVSADRIIHELDTILGINDGHELVGRRVDLHVPIQQRLSDATFWIGSADNRLLVVLTGRARLPHTGQKGHPAAVAISGVVRALPKPEVVERWGLADADRNDLLQRRIYVQAEAVEAPNQAVTAP